MCRSLKNGGKRCLQHNPYGIKRRNLLAKKEYHQRKLNSNLLTKNQQTKSKQIVTSTTKSLVELDVEKNKLGFVKPFVMNLTSATETVLKQLETDGLTPYIVGGSVRDALLGTDLKDVDIEVYGGETKTVIASLQKIGKVDEVGKAFGVLKIAIGNEDFDVSLPRVDSKTGNGHKGFQIDVNPNLSLKEATARRDYTVNALMYSHQLGFIIDQHDGLKDLNSHLLHHVSDAFDEDPLRVLRGVQMASRFGMNLHPDTIEKAKILKNNFKDLAVERVQVEFEKLYSKGKTPVKALKLLKETEWDTNFPGLAEANTSQLHRQVKKMQKLIDDNVVPKERKAIFLSATIANSLSNENRSSFLHMTTVGDDTKNAAVKLSTMKIPRKQGKASLRTWAYSMPRNLSIRDWVTLEKAVGDKKKAIRILTKAEKLGIADSSEPDFIKGEDIMALKPNDKPGSWMKTLLDKTREAQYSDQFRTRENGLKWIQANL